MKNYHRNTIAGPVTIKGKTTTFSSLKDDFAVLGDKLQKQNLGESQTIGPTEQGADIQVLRMGKDPSMPILISGGHWAREWISVEIPYLFAEYLVDNYTTDKKVQRIVDGTELWFIPMVNPDGHENSVLKDRLWAKNFPNKKDRQSVNINRNYDTSTWASLKNGNSSKNPANYLYQGPSPAYALEVIAMQKFVNSKPFKGLLNYTSFGRFVVYPWAGKSVPPPNPKLNELATTVKSMIDSRGTVYTKLQDNMLYTALRGVKPEQALYAGSLTDYVVEKLPDCIALGVLLEPDQHQSEGNLLPEDKIESTFNLHRASMLTFLNCVSTAQKQPVPKPMKLNRPGIPSTLVAYQTDCSKGFQEDKY